MTEMEKLIDFLGTETLSFTFSPAGLQYLSLRARRGERELDLGDAGQKGAWDTTAALIVAETQRFLATGAHDMPLDLSGFTPFQQSVFEAVLKVPPGEITTYKGIAEMLGKPGAAQAVGSAVAKNPVAYFLPTHRVLPQRGIGICRTGAGHLREKLLAHEGHDVDKLRGNYVCSRRKCCME